MNAHAARAIGYRRVSTLEQSHSGLGLDAQEVAITNAAARLAIPVSATFTDAGISGGLPLEQRPGLLGALDTLRRGDVIVVAKRDRLGRDVLNVAMFERLVERKGARVVSAAGEGTETDDPTSRLMRQIIDCFAEYERALIRARTRAALAIKKTRGERCGGIPFGYQLAPDGRTLAESPVEKYVLEQLRCLRDRGYSYQAIAAELNRMGFRSRTGAEWVRQSVHALIRSQAA
jgi:DNA invertase Pin-like site-specific DNA recombinase